MHGGTNPGAAKGNRHAWKHGDRSGEAEAQLKAVHIADRDLRLLAKFRQGLSLKPRELDHLIELMVRNGRWLGRSLDDIACLSAQNMNDPEG
jgi:hypothetical protein